jgi:sporulation protein YpjB
VIQKGVGPLRTFWLTVIFACLFQMMVPAVHATGMRSLETEEWSRLANQVAKWAGAGEYIKARDQLLKLSGRFSKADFTKLNLRIESIHALAEVIMEMEGALNRVQPNSKEIADAAARLQLAFDALTHPNQPMWQQYYQPLKKDLDMIDEAIRMNDRHAVQEGVDQFYEHYQIIRPALIVAKSPFTISKVDSLVTFLRNQTEMDKLKIGVTQLKSLLNPLFFGSERDVMATVYRWNEGDFFKVILWVSGLIASVLGFVSWRKYRENREASPYA